MVKILKENFENILNEYDLDIELKNHLMRVSKYAEALAILMNLDSSKIQSLKKGALLHDIGKTMIDKNILNKPSKLTEEEFELIKKHSKLGFKILTKQHRDKNIENAILFHHEKWDGKGYPFGLTREDIPIEARIVSIVDCYDALTSKRIYKNRFSHEEALKILKSESGKSFDPFIVSIFNFFNKRFEEMAIKNEFLQVN